MLFPPSPHYLLFQARVQRASITNSFVPGRVVLRDLLAREGIPGLFKGLTTKICIVGPKLIFSFTVFQQVMALTDRVMRRSSPSTEESPYLYHAPTQSSFRITARYTTPREMAKTQTVVLADEAEEMVDDDSFGNE